MNRQRYIANILFGLLFVVCSVAMAQNAPALRVLRGSVHPATLQAQDNGVLDPATKLNELHLYIAPSAAKKHALTQLLSDQRTPGTANYHRWLTPADFGARFGASVQDENALRSWLNAQGFKNVALSPSRSIFTFSGTAKGAGTAFHTSIHALTVDGERHYANTTDISLPSGLASLVLGIRGLDDFKPKPHVRRMSAQTPQLTNSGIYSLAPGDIATIYDLQSLYAAGIDGKGITAAVVGQTDIAMSDIAAYRNGFGLPSNLPTVVLVPTSSDPGTSPVDVNESDLDLELLGAVAPNATLLYVNSGNVGDSLEYAINQNLASVISMSYGGCEANTGAADKKLSYLYDQANAQGITLVVASGDTGPAACDTAGKKAATYGLNLDTPANSPNWTSVGGTSFVTPTAFTSSLSIYFSNTNGANGGSAISYIPETAWNETASQNHLEASGGGVSSIYAKPGWQAGPGVPVDGMRNVPDISLYAGNEGMGYITCSNNDCAGGPPNLSGSTPSGGIWGGTSAGTPVFAGIVALLNQYLLSKGDIAKPGLGNVNPNLYLMASGNSTGFHDITSGNNIVPCVTGTPDCSTGSFGYSAGSGYDQVTGLGSIDAYNLVSQWSSYTIVGTSVKLTSSASTVVDGQSVTLTATVTPVSGTTVPTGRVTFYTQGTCDGITVGAAGAACGEEIVTLGSSMLDATGKATWNTSALSFGSAVSILAEYEGTQEFAQSSSAVFSQGVLVPTTTTVTGPTLSAAWGPWVAGQHLGFNVAVAPVDSFQGQAGVGAVTGTVTLYNGAIALGTVAVNGGNGYFDGTSLPAGKYSVTGVFAGAGDYAPSTSPVVSQTIVPSQVTPVNTTTTLTSSVTQAVQGTSVTLSASVAAVAGASVTTTPTGTVTFYNGTTNLGSGAITSGTASLTLTTLAVGTDALTATYSGDTTFASSQTSASVTVVITAAPQPSFALSASPSSVTVTGGQSASATLTVTPANGFNQTLTFACSGLPSGATCSFAAPSVQTNGTSTVALKITTATLTAANHTEVQDAPIFALLPCLLLLSRKRRGALLNACTGMLLAIILTSAGFGLIGCGGGGGASQTTPTTPTKPTSQTSTVTVTATTATGLSQSSALTLIVN